MDIYQTVERFYESVTTEKCIIGKSVFGRNLYAVKVGRGYPVGLAQYAIHGREYVTALIALRHYAQDLPIGSFWLVPLINPDGALLSQVGIESVKNEKDKQRLIEYNGGVNDFSQWKANGRGVDLNVNFPALWGKGAKNTRVAGAENYIGEYPFSEPETLALKKFTEKIKPDYTISYHTKGEEIYWYFYQSMRTCSRDKRLALAVSASTGYALSHAKGSAGGYKDWCVRSLKIPSLTIEAGRDCLQHPITEKDAGEILQKNERVLYDITKEYLLLE